jgi:hypothetical protein
VGILGWWGAAPAPQRGRALRGFARDASRAVPAQGPLKRVGAADAGLAATDLDALMAEGPVLPDPARFAGTAGGGARFAASPEMRRARSRRKGP